MIWAVSEKIRISRLRIQFMSFTFSFPVSFLFQLILHPHDRSYTNDTCSDGWMNEMASFEGKNAFISDSAGISSQTTTARFTRIKWDWLFALFPVVHNNNKREAEEAFNKFSSQLQILRFWFIPAPDATSKGSLILSLKYMHSYIIKWSCHKRVVAPSWLDASVHLIGDGWKRK